MSKIIGVTVGTTRPRANLGQTDPKKSDYINNRPTAKTEAMTQPVGVDENGDLWTVPGGVGGITKETDPTVPEWAKQPNKPTYTADEVKARPNTWMPTAEDVGARPSTWTPTASDVGADASGTAASKVTEHNAATDAHNDIRLLIQGLDARLTALADSDDTTLDQLSELVAYIKDNRELIESVTTAKVNVSDIINNLTTNDAKKPLSAAQGVALKALIDALTTTVNGKVTDAQVATAISNALKAYPTTTAMQTAISTALADYAKADHNHDGVYAAKSHNHDGTYAKPSDIPTKLSQLTGDSTHRTVTDAEKTGWNEKAAGDHNHDGVYVKQTELNDAVNTALETAKESGEFNGTDGDDGYTPVAGVDYPTDAQIDKKIAAALAERNQLEPLVAESVDWLKSNGDPTKVYIIPNADGQGGKVYAYAEVSGEVTYTLADAVCSTDAQQTSKWVSGAGYSTASRINSSGVVVQGNDQASGFIPARAGDVITVRNYHTAATQVCYLAAYDDSGNKVGIQTINNSGTDISTAENANKWCSSKSANSFTATLTEANFGSGFTQIRINGVLTDASVSVTGMRNQSSWYAFTDFVATDDARINALDDRVKTLEAGGASNIKTREAALKLMKEWDKPVYDQLEPFMLDHTLSVDGSRYVTYTDTQDTDGSKRRAQVTALYGEYDALCAEHPDFVRDITNVAHGLEGANETTYGGLCSDGVQTVKVYEFKEVDPLRNEAGNEWSETKPKMILISGIHWEWGGAYALFHALNEITTNPALRYIRRNMHFVVMPITNPYTFTSFGDTGTGHYNKNGVEIHNNFEVDFNNAIDSTHGTAALSEVETRYINNVMRKHSDAAFMVSAHSHQGNADRPNRSIWPSTATYFGCNIGYRLIDMMSHALSQKYGTDWSGDNRAGHGSLSSSSGTEAKQAMLYGIHGLTLEIGDTFHAFSADKLSDYVITHGAETYINFIRIAMTAYSIHDRNKYAPKPAYEVEE